MYARHVFPTTAEINKYGHLTLGGCDTTELASRFGTPLYIYDEQTLRDRCRSFNETFKHIYPETLVAYASKAYINPALASIIHQEGLGLDVVSGGELAVAQASNFSPANVYFHGNNKGKEELEQALQWGIGRIVIDNFHEIEVLDELAGQIGTKQKIMLRVSPGIDPHTHSKTTTGTLDSKFGFPIETGDAESAIRTTLKSPHLDLMGLHFHLGSPIFELEPYSAAIELVLHFAAKFKDEGLELREFSPGGGFAIAYTCDQEPPTVSAYAETIVSTLIQTCRGLSIELPRLIIEPGRAISGPAGVALYRTGSVKDIQHIRKYVSVDGGMGDNIRPALYDATYEVTLANRMNDPRIEKVTIAGKYCESGDVLVRDAMLPPMKTGEGDLIAIPASGAYCPAMASNYNLNPKPAIVLVNDGSARLIRRRETYQDQMFLDIL